MGPSQRLQPNNTHKNRYPCLRKDSNSQSQQASCRIPTARPLGSLSKNAFVENKAPTPLPFASLSVSPLFRFAHCQTVCSILVYLFRVRFSPFVNCTTQDSLWFIDFRFLESSLPSHTHCNLIWLCKFPKIKIYFDLLNISQSTLEILNCQCSKHILMEDVMYCNGVHVPTFQTHFYCPNAFYYPTYVIGLSMP